MSLEPHKVTLILRNYIHEQENGVRTCYRLGGEMAKASGISSRTQDNGDINVLSFIEQLRGFQQLDQLLPRLEFDYISLTLQCNKLCRNIDVAQSELALGRPPATEDSWKSPNTLGFSLVSLVLRDFDCIVLSKKSGKKVHNAYIPDKTEMAAVAVQEMGKYISKLVESR